jgi:hypothetical protein
MYTFAHNETNNNYRKPPSPYASKKDQEGSNKPSKFAIVLSHHYTPAGLSSGGLAALKGSDRAIGELVRAAAWCRPSQLMPSAEHQTGEDPVQYFDAVLSLSVLFGTMAKAHLASWTLTMTISVVLADSVQRASLFLWLEPP